MNHFKIETISTFVRPEDSEKVNKLFEEFLDSLQQDGLIETYFTHYPFADVFNAWHDVGPNPNYHQGMKDQLKRQWPTLYNALSEVLD